jgi:DNA-binding NarL/FixJ family response regulator
MKKIRILVADDHPAYREGLCRLLNDEKDLIVVGESDNGEDAVSLAKELEPDVAIMDVAMPKLNGIEAAIEIKRTCPDIAILIVSAYDYESYMLDVLKAGAEGYMLKTVPLRELISAVRFVYAGEGVFDLKVGKNVLQRLAAKDEQRGDIVGLRHREIQVLKLAAKGISNKEIATELVISERTVQTHLNNVFKKLKVSSRTEAVLRTIKEGWLNIDDLP